MVYSGGVIPADSCPNGQENINHGVTLVGYTADKWIIRNSWGARWGDGGYVYLQRDASNAANNACGILELNTFPEL